MDKLHLSQQAEESVSMLIASKDSEKVGDIAAIDPETGEAFYGKTVGEAAKEGRRVKGNPQAVFFFIRVGYPSVHVLKRLTLQGSIHQLYFPLVKGYVKDRSFHIVSSLPGDADPVELIADTGFSGALVLDTKVIHDIDTDYLGEDTTTLAGGIVQSVNLYLSDVFVETLRLSEVEILEMPEEYLLGIALMRGISKKVTRYTVDGMLQVTWTPQTTATKHYLKRGRHGLQSPFEVVTTTTWQVIIEWQREAIAIAQQVAGWRLSVTNAPALRLDLPGAVACYRDQWQPERGVHRLKGAALAMRPLLLRSDARIGGLVCLLVMA